MNELTHPRLIREAETVEAMIRLYCRGKHGQTELCADCTALVAYTRVRLAKCPFQAEKPTCGQCKVHCYKPVLREQIRQVMRYAGPRMLLSHPLMAFQHLLDGQRKAPDRKVEGKGAP